MNEQNSSQNVQAPADTAYEAPAIETVLSSDELEREVFYAGAAPTISPINVGVPR
jgi:hypothetical protein